MGTLTIFVSLLIPGNALGQSCSVTFETATVKPSVWDSFMTLLKSFNPKGEVERLMSLEKEVHQLKDDKHQLADTLNTVLQQNSVPSWLEARVKEIPDIQNKVLLLLTNIRSEAAEGGVFGGPPPDKTYYDLEELVGKKGRDLGQLCVLTQQPLPLIDPSRRQQLQTLVDNLNKEVDALGKIDDQLGALIQKAHDQETAGKTKQKKD
jgi:hypothetical protein